jgi:hypothetical protein
MVHGRASVLCEDYDDLTTSTGCNARRSARKRVVHLGKCVLFAGLGSALVATVLTYRIGVVVGNYGQYRVGFA